MKFMIQMRYPAFNMTQIELQVLIMARGLLLISNFEKNFKAEFYPRGKDLNINHQRRELKVSVVAVIKVFRKATLHEN